MGKAAKYYSWWFIVNNWTDANKFKINKLINKQKLQYVIYGEANTHIQGYLQTQRLCTLQQVSRLLSGKKCAHPFAGLPRPDKSPAYWKEYCTNTYATVFEWGTLAKDATVDICNKEKEYLDHVSHATGSLCANPVFVSLCNHQTNDVSMNTQE